MQVSILRWNLNANRTTEFNGAKGADIRHRESLSSNEGILTELGIKFLQEAT
jgi:hypothetical protein